MVDDGRYEMRYVFPFAPDVLLTGIVEFFFLCHIAVLLMTILLSSCSHLSAVSRLPYASCSATAER